jgi:hypothetical protein
MRCWASVQTKRTQSTAYSRGNGGRRDDLGFYVRSAWEANYARYLNWLQSQGQIARWQYEPDTFEFAAIKRGSRFYTPDFKVFQNNGSHEYHEIKGYMDQGSATKLKRMARYFPHERVVVIGANEYKSIARAVAKLVPNWESKQ